MSDITDLAHGAVNGADELSVQLIQPRPAGCRQNQLAATPHDSRRRALPCCCGGDCQDHRRECNGAGTTQGGRTMSNDIKAFLLSVGGLLVVAGSGLLLLWAGLGGLTWLD
jgi:hypothetical protein